MNDFEKSVRIALINVNMSMGDLADQMGITRSYLWDILKGNRPAVDMRQKICDFLKIEGGDADAQTDSETSS